MNTLRRVAIQVDERVVVALASAECSDVPRVPVDAAPPPDGARAPEPWEGYEPRVLALHYGFAEGSRFEPSARRFHAPLPVSCLRRGLQGSRSRWRRYSVDTWLAATTADAFWARCRPRYPVAAVRDGAWLCGRFRSRPGVRYHVLVARRWGRLGAWAVLRLAEGAAHLADLAWDGDDPRALHALDDEAVRAAQAFGAQGMETWLHGDDAAREVLLDHGWEPHPDPSTLRLTTVVFDRGIDGPELTRRFYLTMGDAERQAR